MLHTKIHLISVGCSLPSVALQCSIVALNTTNFPTLCIVVTGTFSCTLKFLVKDCDPNTGEPDDDGYEDEYVVRVFGKTAVVIGLWFIVVSVKTS